MCPSQFLRYETGGFFVAHQDGNTPLTRDRTRDRRISIVIFLNAQTPENLPGGYTGGELVFHVPYPHLNMRHAVVGAAGSLLAFRSETTHEVTMVTGGERYTIATWLHGTHGVQAGQLLSVPHRRVWGLRGAGRVQDRISPLARWIVDMLGWSGSLAVLAVSPFQEQ